VVYRGCIRCAFKKLSKDGQSSLNLAVNQTINSAVYESSKVVSNAEVKGLFKGRCNQSPKRIFNQEVAKEVSKPTNLRINLEVKRVFKGPVKREVKNDQRGLGVAGGERSRLRFSRASRLRQGERQRLAD
jgi:hypothetical protein